jgi:hypothetical protein
METCPILVQREPFRDQVFRPGKGGARRQRSECCLRIVEHCRTIVGLGVAGLQANRLSILWKAEIRYREPSASHLTLDRIMSMSAEDLRRRGLEFTMPSDPLADTAWILFPQRVYVGTEGVRA